MFIQTEETPNPSTLKVGAFTFWLDPTHEPLSYQCKRALLIQRLNRPLRVCGVVPNTGEPGGGPFWVREPNGGLGLQIVEASQVDTGNARQLQILIRRYRIVRIELIRKQQIETAGLGALIEHVDEPVSLRPKIADGSGTPTRPAPVISNTPSSFVEPNRFLTARSTRWAW